jgi:tetratricopeptide (TPR) repeat protein
MKNSSCIVMAIVLVGLCWQPSFAVRSAHNDVTGELIQDYRELLIQANEAVENNPRDAQSYLNRANLKRKMENFPAALSDYNAAYKLSPANTKILIGRGIILRYLGHNSLAVRDFEKAVAIDPTLKNDLEENPESDLAGLNVSLSRIAENDEWIKREPSNPVAYIERANTQLDFNNWHAAVANFDAAIKLAPNFKTYGSLDIPYLASLQLGFNNKPILANLYVWRGTTYKFHKKYTEARLDLERAIELDPTNPYAYITLGHICVFLGDRPAALKAFDSAARIDKSLAYELSQFYAEEGNNQMEKNVSEQCYGPLRKQLSDDRGKDQH